MPPDELGGRVQDHVGAMLKGAAEVWGGDGRVHDQRHAHRAGTVGQSLQVGDHARGIGNDLGVERLGFGTGGRHEPRRVVRSDEGGLDPEAPQRDVEQRAGAAVEGGTRHEVITGTGQSGEDQHLGRLAARGGDRADSTFEARHAFFERRHGRIGDPGVDVPVLLQGEQVGGIGGVLEHEGGGLVDRDGAGARGGVGPVAGVDGPCPKAPLVILHRRHVTGTS